MKRLIQELTLLSVVAIWGFNYTIGKFGMVQLSPFEFNTIRFMAAAPLLLLITLMIEKNITVRLRDLPLLAVVGLVGITLYQGFFLVSVKYATAAAASLLISASPVFTNGFAVLFKQERWSATLLMGSLIALCGATLVLLGGGGLHEITSNGRFGLIAGLIASILWGLYPVVASALLTKYSVLRVTAWSSVMGAIPFILITGLGSGFASIDWDWTGSTWFAMLYSVLLVTIYGLIFWYRNINKVGSSRVMLYMYLVPIFAVVFAYYVTQEQIYPLQLLGCLFIITGITLSKGMFRRRNKAV